MNNKRMSFNLLFYLIALSLFEFGTVQSQPYYYYTKRHNFQGYAIHRVNLQNGVSELFTPDTLAEGAIDWDPTQSWLYSYFYRRDAEFIEVINVNNPTKRHTFPDDGIRSRIYGIVYVPQKNRFYFSRIPLGTQTVKTTVYDASIFALLDSIPESVATFFSSDDVSEDGSIIYTGKWDKSTDLTYYQKFSTSSHTIVSSKRFLDINLPTRDYITPDGRKGNILFGYDYPVKDAIDGHYVVYDASRDILFPDISFPWISTNVYLSGDAKYVIIEETPVNPDRNSSAPSHILTGKIYIFEAATGKLTQKLNLPLGGRIFIFDNYPEKFYYYREYHGVPQSTPVSVSAITPTNVLMDTLISLKHQAQSNNWLGDKNFVNELDKGLENAKKHLIKGDSVNCAKELEKFQDKVKKEYEKKSASRDKRFVTEDGYKLLYFNGQYIIDRLPKKK